MTPGPDPSQRKTLAHFNLVKNNKTRHRREMSWVYQVVSSPSSRDLTTATH